MVYNFSLIIIRILRLCAVLLSIFIHAPIYILLRVVYVCKYLCRLFLLFVINIKRRIEHTHFFTFFCCCCLMYVYNEYRYDNLYENRNQKWQQNKKKRVSTGVKICKPRKGSSERENEKKLMKNGNWIRFSRKKNYNHLDHQLIQCMNFQVNKFR